MAKETKRTTPRPSGNRFDERAGKKGPGKRQPARSRVPEKVTGIKSDRRFQDDEEKLLNRRSRLRASGRGEEPPRRSARRPSAAGNEPVRPGRSRGRTTGEERSQRPDRRDSGQRGEFSPNRRERSFNVAGENIRRPGRPSTGRSFSSRDDQKREGAPRPFKSYNDRGTGPRRVQRGKESQRTEKLQPYTDEMRLNRFIANSGICSRREADKYIETGLVTINGKIVTELGTKVLPNDEVRFDGKRLIPEKKVYLLLNKPKGFVTTTEDPKAEKTVMDLIKDACPERIYPVGRLDKNTTGLLLFTNDGELSKRLTHPSFNSKKIYQVTLDNPVTKQDLQQIADGIELDDGPIAADQISYLDPEDRTEVGIEIHSGRNRVVRRMFEHLGYNVRKLDRVFYAGLTKKDLPRGKWRILSPKEIGFLKMN